MKLKTVKAAELAAPFAFTRSHSTADTNREPATDIINSSMDLGRLNVSVTDGLTPK